MKARNWATPIYDTEDALGLWWRWPFLDLADAIAMWNAIQTADHWKAAVGDQYFPLEFRREHKWEADSGIRRARGTFVYDMGVGMSCGGVFLHESCHMAYWTAKRHHGDRFLRLWLGLWKDFSRTPTFNAICDQLRKGGVPVEEFV